MNREIIDSFKETVNSEITEVSTEYGELALDLFINDSLFKDIPFIRTIVSVFKIGKTVHDALYIRNLYIFLENLRSNKFDEDEIKKRKEHIKKSKNLQKEIEYILIYCDRMVESDNVQYIAMLYLSLMDGKIEFDNFISYLSVLDRLLPGDIDFLLANLARTTNINSIDEHFLRLTGLGLMLKTNGKLEPGSFGNHKTITTSLMDVTFTLSHFGSDFLSAIGK